MVIEIKIFCEERMNDLILMYKLYFIIVLFIFFLIRKNLFKYINNIYLY